MSTSIPTDAAVGVAYIQLSKKEIVRSIETTNGVVLDLDKFDVIVGIEVLNLFRTFSVNDIQDAAHLNSSDEEPLRMALQSIARMRMTSSLLNNQSKVHVRANNGKTLVAC